MQHGDEKSANLFKLILEDTGKPHPAALTRPALRDDCIKYYDAFCLLSACRMWSEVGPQPIQISEVESYTRMAGIDEPRTRLKYARLIRRLDTVVINYINAQRQKQK